MPPKAPADRPPTSRLPKFEPPDHRACNSLTPFRCPHAVHPCPSVDSGLRVARERSRGEIHLLLTDVVMPLLGGRGLAERLRADQPSIKVLYTSGYAEPSLAEQMGLEFMQKPFTPQVLARKVREVLDA